VRPEPPLGGEVGAVNPLARLIGSNRFRHRRHKTKHHLPPTCQPSSCWVPCASRRNRFAL